MEINHRHTSEIICPWCGHTLEDTYVHFFYIAYLGLEECPKCNRSFDIIREIEIAYTTKKSKYGTCKKCGAEHVIVKSLDCDTWGYEDFCESCRNDEYAKFLEHFLQTFKRRKKDD